MKTKSIKTKLWEHKSIFIFLGIMFLYTICMKEISTGDAFRNFRYVTDYSQSLKARWNIWTSRILIEPPLYYLSAHVELWKILNFSIFSIILVIFKRLFKNTSESLIICILLLYPISEISSAGWIATFMNYLWPLSFCFISLIFIDKVCNEKHIGILEFIFYSLCEIYALNMEQLAVVYIAILIYTTGYLIHHKIKNHIWMYLIHILIAIISLIIFLICPGNYRRLIKETTKWMIYFPQLSLVNKLSSGFIETMHSMLFGNRIFLILVLVIFIGMLIRFKKNKCNKMQLIVTSFPIGFTLILRCQEIFDGTFNNFYLLFSSRIPNSMNYFMLSTYIPAIFYILVVAAILITLIYMFDDIFKSIELCFIFLIGLGSRMMLGFSPTLYASGPRTFCVMEYTLIFLILRLIQYDNDLKENKYIVKYGKYALTCYVVISVLNDIGYICGIL